ncbi:hypothetical protein PIROE2DRAFT_61858 [Piromyces sp. E2]|nr:hypothetical protein PIROE2DRAFT_61858 [Piromyces sp. E2]|eukprot:OUM62503.1 hypothetical protein PIROE2DRAFT_61858 [Piromyces sp. E2]
MKFTHLITLLIISSTFAINIPSKRNENENENEILEEEFNYSGATNFEGDNDPSLDVYGEECTNFYTNIDKCIEGIDSKTKEEICNQFNSKECQTILKKDTSACKEYGSSYDVYIASLRLTCTKNENNEYCPISKAQQSGKEDEFTDIMIQDTCKSKLCTESALEGFKMLKDSVDDVTNLTGENVNISDYDIYINALSECTDANSGASNIRIGSTLLFILALIFSFF